MAKSGGGGGRPGFDGSGRFTDSQRWASASRTELRDAGRDYARRFTTPRLRNMQARFTDAIARGNLSEIQLRDLQNRLRVIDYAIGIREF